MFQNPLVNQVGSDSQGNAISTSLSSLRHEARALHQLVKGMGQQHDQSCIVSKSSKISERVRRGSRLQGFDERALDLVSFQGCEDLLRASELGTVLQHGAGVFSSNTGAPATYALSERVSMIDTFISHNWSVSRWLKLAALTYNFNLRIAIAEVGVVSVVLGIVTAMGLLPVMQTEMYVYPRGFFCGVFFAPTFLLCLLFGRPPRRYFRFWERFV